MQAYKFSVSFVDLMFNGFISVSLLATVQNASQQVRPGLRCAAPCCGFVEFFAVNTKLAEMEV